MNTVWYSEYCAGEEVHTTVVSLPPTYDKKELCESSPASSYEYMNKIRKRLNEDASARAEREKRRRKVLVEQLTAHQALEVRCFVSSLVICLDRYVFKSAKSLDACMVSAKTIHPSLLWNLSGPWGFSGASEQWLVLCVDTNTTTVLLLLFFSLYTG